LTPAHPLARIFVQPRLGNYFFSELAGTAILILSTLIVGYGNSRKVVVGRC
jgi:hypothetical protein